MATAKPLPKSQIIANLSENSGVAKKDVSAVLDHLEQLIAESLSKKGPGVLVLPGLMKIQVKVKPKTPARKGRNPKTGEEITIAAKPARKAVKVTPLKKLKEMAK